MSLEFNFKITDQQFLKIGDLIDYLIKEHKVRQQGVVVVRLRDPPEPKEDEETVLFVQRSINKDRIFKIFKPELLQRKALSNESNALEIVACGEASKDIERAYLLEQRMTFKEKVLSHDFLNHTKTELELSLEVGMNHFLETFFNMLSPGNPEISRSMYAANMSFSRPLNTKKNLKMKDMDSLVKHLRGGNHRGITTPTVYIGSEGSPFNLHREDESFEGVNRMVAGAPKVWFVVPPKFFDRTTSLLSKVGLNRMERNCRIFIQHKFVFIDPRVLFQNNIPVHTIVQYPGDIVIVLSNAIHWGINTGINLNEAINVACTSWAYPGMISQGRCECPERFRPLCVVPDPLHIEKRLDSPDSDGEDDDVEFLEVKESTSTRMSGGGNELERICKEKTTAMMTGDVAMTEAGGDSPDLFVCSEEKGAEAQALRFDAEKKVFEYEKQVAKILMKHQPCSSDLVKKYLELAPVLRPSMIAVLLTIHPLQRRAVLKDIQAVLPPVAALKSRAGPLSAMRAAFGREGDSLGSNEAHLELCKALDNKSSGCDNMPLFWSWLSGDNGESDSYLFAAP